MVFTTKPRITATTATKGKVRPGKQRLYAKRRQDRCDKTSGIGAAQIVIKPDVNDPVDSEGGDQPVLFRSVGKMERYVIMTEELARMRVKRHHRRGKALCPRRIDGGGNHLGMPAMDTVEIADGGDQRRPVQRGVANTPVDGLATLIMA